jgi:hypothetical protein
MLPPTKIAVIKVPLDGIQLGRITKSLKLSVVLLGRTKKLDLLLKNGL